MSVFDVVIIGGGPAGCATALSFFKNAPNATCLVVDDADPSTFKIGESLPPESGRLLHYLHPSLPSQLSSRLSSGVYTACTGNASAWASPILEERHAIMNPFGHGRHLNRADFDEMLRDTVRSCSSTSKPGLVLEKSKFKTLQRNQNGSWNIELDVAGELRNITANWIVDASGRKASVATKLGKKSISSNPLLAFYGVFTAPEVDDLSTCDNDKRTLIEATADGWWYSSLISRNPCTRIVVFHTLPSHPAAKSSRRFEGFLERLHDTSTHISSIITKWDYELQGGYPRCTAAGSSYLEKSCSAAERWVAVGDAAMAFDPLSSQGIVTALEMGIYVGLQLSQHIAVDGKDIEFDQRIGDIYSKLQDDYDTHRAYYYSVVKRFPGEQFWEEVCKSTVS